MTRSSTLASHDCWDSEGGIFTFGVHPPNINQSRDATSPTAHRQWHRHYLCYMHVRTLAFLLAVTSLLFTAGVGVFLYIRPFFCKPLLYFIVDDAYFYYTQMAIVGAVNFSSLLVLLALLREQPSYLVPYLWINITHLILLLYAIGNNVSELVDCLWAAAERRHLTTGDILLELSNAFYGYLSTMLITRLVLTAFSIYAVFRFYVFLRETRELAETDHNGSMNYSNRAFVM